MEHFFRKSWRRIKKFIFFPILEACIVAGPVSALASTQYIHGVKLWFDERFYMTIICSIWFIPGAIIAKVIKNKFNKKKVGIEDNLGECILTLI